jgi:hypothetical protein
MSSASPSTRQKIKEPHVVAKMLSACMHTIWWDLDSDLTTTALSTSFLYLSSRGKIKLLYLR